MEETGKYQQGGPGGAAAEPEPELFDPASGLLEIWNQRFPQTLGGTRRVNQLEDQAALQQLLGEGYTPAYLEALIVHLATSGKVEYWPRPRNLLDYTRGGGGIRVFDQLALEMDHQQARQSAQDAAWRETAQKVGEPTPDPAKPQDGPVGISRAYMERVSRRLEVLYRGLWTEELGRALWEEFGKVVSEAEFSEAIRRHLHNPTPDRSGQPAGKWPPSVADLEGHLRDIYVEKLRKRQDQAGSSPQAREEEGDSHYLEFLQGASRSQRLNELSRLRKREVEKSFKIRGLLQEKFKLDYRKSEDMKLLMQTLGEAVDSAGYLLPLQQVLAVAYSLKTPPPRGLVPGRNPAEPIRSG